MNIGGIRFGDSAIMTATTVGAGIFSLPFIFKEAGLLVGAFYLIVLSLIVISIHILYWVILKKTGGKMRLLGLARAHLGDIGYLISFAAIIIGLLLTLVVYLILGGRFLSLIFPNIPYAPAVIIFWLLGV